MALSKPGLTGSGRIGDSRLARRISDEIEGEVKFDPFTRGRYSTDASHYQVEPIGVVVPKSTADIISTIHVACEEGIAVLPRGGGTSQCGQTVCEAIVLDCTKRSYFLRYTRYGKMDAFSVFVSSMGKFFFDFNY